MFIDYSKLIVSSYGKLFQDANKIADLLVAVMDRKTKEEKEGKPQEATYENFSQSPKNIKKGLEELGHEKRLKAERQWMTEGQPLRPGLKQLRPEDLPPDVTASRGYDHRGLCLIFEDKILGDLGKIVLIKIRDGQMLIQAELYKGEGNLQTPLVQKKKKVFEEVVATVDKCFNENFPE